MASAQDIAKFSCAASAAWALLEALREDVVKPCLLDIAQAVRFKGEDFNPQDTSLTITAFAKVESIDDMIADILAERVVAHASRFTNKDLCLLLWSVVHSTWAGDHLKDNVLKEVQNRNLSRFSVKDLCMATQALAKIGSPGHELLNFFVAQAYERELHSFSACDRMYLLWAVAKSKVTHLPLCRMIIRQLSDQNCSRAPRGALSAALWSVAVLFPALKPADDDMASLVAMLCQASPWKDGASYEVANAAWAFGQLASIVPFHCWMSLCKTADQIKHQISLHELCNLLHGFAACPKEVEMGAVLFDRFASEVSTRLSRKAVSGMALQADKGSSTGLDALSDHDLRSLSGLLALAGHPIPSQLQELAGELHVEPARGKATHIQENGIVPSEQTDTRADAKASALLADSFQ
jgi:hypothetical protein